MPPSRLLKTFVLSFFVLGLSTYANDRELFYPSWQTGSKASQKFLLEAGQAPIDEALEKIIPMPYQIILDETVPETIFLVWSASNNWMQSLEMALAPIGLEVSTNWPKNEVIVSWKVSNETRYGHSNKSFQENLNTKNTNVLPEVIVQAKPLIGRGEFIVHSKTDEKIQDVKPVASKRGKFSVTNPVFGFSNQSVN